MMVKMLLVAAIAAAAAGCERSAPMAPAVATSPVTAPSGQVGRYQLFQGWYRFVNLKGEEHRTETLFKIDTATGELFECSSVQFVQDEKSTQKTACLPFEGDLSLGAMQAAK